MGYNAFMLKRTTKHEFYEVWSEDAAESVFVDRKPTRDEVNDLWKKNWPNTHQRPKLFKLKPFYIQSPKQHWMERDGD